MVDGSVAAAVLHELAPGHQPVAVDDELAEFVLELCEVLNPSRIPGRLTLISRMGADDVTGEATQLLARLTGGESGAAGNRTAGNQTG